jgi:hypothetical protein
MTNEHKGFIAGLALGSFISMLLILFSCIAVANLAPVIVPLASVGVFLGIFAASLIAMTWVTQPAFGTKLTLLAELA